MPIFSDPLPAGDCPRLARNRRLTRVMAPESEPLALDEARLYLRLDHKEEDTLVCDLMVAARMMAESWLRSSLITQSWQLAYDDGIAGHVPLPMGPVAGITSVVIVNRDTTTQMVAASGYSLNAARNALVLDNPVTGFRIEITYQTGYGDAQSVPRPIKLGLLAHIADMYDNRDYASSTLPPQVAALYLPFRELRL